MECRPPKVSLDIERPCSWAEHTARIEVVRNALGARGLDALLVTSLHSIYYLFGIDRFVSAGVFVGALISTTKGTITISYYDHDVLFEQSPVVGEVRYWTKDHSEAARLVAEAVGQLGARIRLGIEADNSAVAPIVHAEIEAQLRAVGAIPVEASDLITRMRVVKSPAEIVCMRRAAAILDAHFCAAFEAMKPGARECDVAGKSVEAMYAAGGDYVIHPPLLTSGVNTLFRTFHGPSRRAFRPGEIIVHEAGASFQRYTVVAGHTVLFGRDPTEEQRSHYAAAREEVDMALSLIGPNVQASKLTQTVYERTAKPGTARGAACMVYSTGIAFQDIWYEGWPLTTEGTNDDEWVLQPGTVVSVFGAAEKRGEFLILCVDPVLITDSGYELLTKLDRSKIRVVG